VATTGSELNSSRVWIADDHPVFRAGLRELIKSSGGYEFVGESAEGGETIGKVLAEEPENVLLDLKFTDISGWRVLATLREKGFAGRILFLTSFSHPLVAVQAAREGANGCVAKDDAALEIIEALDSIHLESSFFLSGTFRSTKRREVKALSGRERELLILIARGVPNKVAADQLGMGPRTAETHRNRIMEKTGARNIADLTSLALNSGLV